MCDFKVNCSLFKVNHVSNRSIVFKQKTRLKQSKDQFQTDLICSFDLFERKKKTYTQLQTTSITINNIFKFNKNLRSFQ